MALSYKPVNSPQDFKNLGQRNFKLEQLSADPSRVEGQVFYNASTHLLKYSDDSAIQVIASKSYVDAQVTAAQNNWDYKEVVRFALTANVDISSALVNGASLGGVTAATGDRALLTGQTDASENGIYLVAASGAASRSSDANSDSEVTQGMHVEVAEGTLAGAAFLLTTANPITLDTTDLDFLQLTGSGSSYTAGDGLNLSGSEFSVDVGDIAGSGLENDGSNNLRIAAAAAGNGLTGGGGSALSVVSDATGGANLAKAVNVSSNGLAVKIDDSTIGEDGSARLFVKNAGITETQLAASVAGPGLAGGAGTALSVNVDDTGIEISTDTLQLKDGGVSAAKIASSVWGSTLVLASSKVNVKTAEKAFVIADWTTSGGEDLLTLEAGVDFDFGVDGSGDPIVAIIDALFDTSSSAGKRLDVRGSCYIDQDETSGDVVIHVVEGEAFDGVVYLRPAKQSA